MPSDTHIRCIFSEKKTIPANGSDTVKFTWSVPRYLDGFRLYAPTANAIEAELVDQSGRVMIGDDPVPIELLSPPQAPERATFPGAKEKLFLQRAQDGLVWTFTNITGNDVDVSVSVWTYAFEPDNVKAPRQVADRSKNAQP